MTQTMNIRSIVVHCILLLAFMAMNACAPTATTPSPTPEPTQTPSPTAVTEPTISPPPLSAGSEDGTETPTTSEEPTEGQVRSEAIQELVEWESEAVPVEVAGLRSQITVSGNTELPVHPATAEDYEEFFKDYPTWGVVSEAIDAECEGGNCSDPILKMVLAAGLPAFQRQTDNPEATVEDFAAALAADPDLEVVVTQHSHEDNEGDEVVLSQQTMADINFYYMQTSADMPPELAPISLQVSINNHPVVTTMFSTGTSLNLIYWNAGHYAQESGASENFNYSLGVSNRLTQILFTMSFFAENPGATDHEWRKWRTGSDSVVWLIADQNIETPEMDNGNSVTLVPFWSPKFPE